MPELAGGPVRRWAGAGGVFFLVCCSCFTYVHAAFPCSSFFRRRRGQNTVEYLLMLGVVASMAVIMLALFHKKILGGIFTLAGLILGAGKPK